MARTYVNALALVIDVIDSFEEDGNPRNGSFFSEFNNEENDNFSVTELDSFGGEGMGDSIWYAFEITDKAENEVYIVKFEGFYNSWDGAYWEEDPFFAKAIERVVTFYEAE